MSHYIHTPQASYGGSTGLSNRQRWEIVIGVIVAVVVGFAAFAFVSNTNTQVVEPAAQPATQSYAAADDLATRTLVPTVESYVSADDLATRSSAAASGSVTQSALDPFELRAGSAPVVATGAAAIIEQSILDALESRAGSGSIIPQSALDPFELRAGSAFAEAGSGSIIPQSALDPFELRLVSPPSNSSVAAPSDPVDERSPNPTPEFR